MPATTIVRGLSWSFDATIFDAYLGDGALGNVPTNHAGWTIRSQIRTRVGNKLVANLNVTFPVPTAGTVAIRHEREFTRSLAIGDYWWSIVATDPQGNDHVYVEPEPILVRDHPTDPANATYDFVPGGGGAVMHKHVIADVTGLQTALNGKAPFTHTHSTSSILGLSAALAGKAPLSHTHTIPDVLGLQDALDDLAEGGVGSVEWDNVEGKPSTFAPSAHKSSHATGGSDALTPADIGIVTSTGGNGTADAGKFAVFNADGGIAAYAEGVYTGGSFDSDDGAGVTGNSLTGDGVFAGSVSGTGLRAQTDSGTYNAIFGSEASPNDRSFVARVLGAFGWFRGAFTGRIQAAATLTGNRTYTLPDATGNVLLDSTLAPTINAATEDTVALAADQLPMTETAASGALRRITFANLFAFVRTQLGLMTGAVQAAGEWAFSSATRPTSAGTGTPAANSLITRADGEALSLFSNSYIREMNRPEGASTAQTSGTGSAGSFGAGMVRIVGSTTASAWQRYHFGDYSMGLAPFFTGQSHAGSLPFAVAFDAMMLFDANDRTCFYAGYVGEWNTALPAPSAAALTARGCCMKLYWSVANNRFEITLHAHNGTTLTNSSPVAAPIPVNFLNAQSFIISSNGQGTVRLYSASSSRGAISMTPLITIGGGPTNGSYPASFTLGLANGSVAPASVPSALILTPPKVHINPTY